MEAKDSFTLTWCNKHLNWYQFNCPDCMIEANEEDIKQEGRREVVGWINKKKIDAWGGNIIILGGDWQALKKERGL